MFKTVGKDIWCEIIAFLVALLSILALYGAIPFWMSPTDIQAVWTAGFAQSFANQSSVFTLYAHDIGVPHPAAISFGLAGAYPASLLIRIGFSPLNAYAMMVAFWLLISFYSAYKIARAFNASSYLATLCALTWLTMPVVFGHRGYSMMGLGIGLLSFYFLSALRLFEMIPSPSPSPSASTKRNVFLYFLATLVSVFMDGYSFMMFATGSSILLGWCLVWRRDIRKRAIRVILPTHVISFGISYLLYCLYIGKVNYEAHSIDVFRGFGLDLSFVVVPTKGLHWVCDALGYGVKRSTEYYFGDASVWNTSFVLPILLLGFTSWIMSRREWKKFSALLLIAAFGFYMALGPSLKVNSVRPEQQRATHQLSASMSAELAIMPTGTALISEHVPGFNVMRASYRWLALSVFMCWLLLVLRSSGFEGKYRYGVRGLFVLLIGINLPHIPDSIRETIHVRRRLATLDSDLVTSLQRDTIQGETAVFIPWGNDFTIAYLAPRAGIRSFNIGGDKNLREAQKHWPVAFLHFNIAVPPENTSLVQAINVLHTKIADVIIAPYFDMRSAARVWPDPSMLIKKRQYAGFLNRARLCPFLTVTDCDFFATIRYTDDFNGTRNRHDHLKAALSSLAYPFTFSTNQTNPDILERGWYPEETGRVWSKEHAKLILPIPEGVASGSSKIVIDCIVFGAKPQRPARIDVSSEDWSTSIVSTAPDGNRIIVPILSTNGYQEIMIAVPNATSPQALLKSADKRKLGIGITKIDIEAFPRLEYGKEYVFDEHLPAEVNGFSGVEDGFRWSDGASAAVSFRVPKGEPDVQVEFRVLPFFGGTRKRQDVGVVVNGEQVQTWVFEQELSIPDTTLQVPRRAIEPDGTITVKFLIRDPHSPKSLGLSPDARLLGIRFLTLAVTDMGQTSRRPDLTEDTTPTLLN